MSASLKKPSYVQMSSRSICQNWMLFVYREMGELGLAVVVVEMNLRQGKGRAGHPLTRHEQLLWALHSVLPWALPAPSAPSLAPPSALFLALSLPLPWLLPFSPVALTKKVLL